MTRRNPERPPGPSYYRLPEASWIMIRDEYLSGWTAKEIGAKWRVSPTSVYRHASDGGWNKYDRGQAFHDQIVAAADAGTGEEWTSWKEPPPESLRQGPRPLPGLWRKPSPAWSPPAGEGPMPPHLVPPAPCAEPPPSAAEVAGQAVAAAGQAIAEGRYREAELLGRLAETLRKQGAGADGAVKPRAGARRSADDPDGDGWESERREGDPPGPDTPLDCTMKSCAVRKIREEAMEAMTKLHERFGPPECDDVVDWVEMAEAMGAAVEPQTAEIAAALRAEGYFALRNRIGVFLGPLPPPPVAEGLYSAGL